MLRRSSALVLAMLTAPCAAAAQALDACNLLTPEEITDAAGWKLATTKGRTYGTTSTCTFTGANAMTQTIVLLVAKPAPKVTTSDQLAERRTREAARHPELKITYTPVEGLEMPAVQSQVEDAKQSSLEMVVGTRVINLTAPEFETSKTLAPKAAARLH